MSAKETKAKRRAIPGIFRGCRPAGRSGMSLSIFKTELTSKRQRFDGGRNAGRSGWRGGSGAGQLTQYRSQPSVSTYPVSARSK